MRIFRTLGTPNEDIWPGVTNLPDFQTRFPQFKVQDIRIQGLNEDGMDLFKVRNISLSTLHIII